MKKFDIESEFYNGKVHNTMDIEDVITFSCRGAHSKIPECCISFWITIFRDSPIESRYPYFDKIHKFRKNLNYVPCPICLKNKNFIKIHMCNPKNEVCRRYMNFDVE